MRPALLYSFISLPFEAQLGSACNNSLPDLKVKVNPNYNEDSSICCVKRPSKRAIATLFSVTSRLI